MTLLSLLCTPLVSAAPQLLPQRLPREAPLQTRWSEGRERDVVIVKLREGGGHALPAIDASQIQPLFAQRRTHRASRPLRSGLAELELYYRVQSPREGAEALCDRLNLLPEVELAYLAFAPAPPPADIDPETPSFRDQQGYLDPAPEGFGFDEARRWPGGLGEEVAIADLEYGWQSLHEDLEATSDIRTWGLETGYYSYHGNSVLGQLFGGDNGYGVTGMIPEAEPVVIFPYTPSGQYNLAEAIDAAGELLEPGDVLLIEQQISAFGGYAPVSYDPATFDAIAWLVEAGVTVVEPAANGGQDLDHPQWEGWFDRSLRDHGGILVGGGSSPYSSTPRAHPGLSSSSSYGSRVDLQGWYDSIVTATTGDSGGYFADLYYPNRDPRQAYTQSFGGTSGASPMVAAAAGVIQSISISLRGEPVAPMQLRALLVETATPESETGREIGPQPDLRRALRVGVLP